MILDHEDHQEIERLLLGRSIIKVSEHQLRLDDGTQLTLYGHVGGCSCGAGDYELTSLNGVDNIITKVEFNSEIEGVYEIFVYADNVRVNLARFEGDDGSGYYGTGYSIEVLRPK